MKKIIQFIFAIFVMAILLELFFQVAEVELPIDEIHPEIGRRKRADAKINRVDEGFFIGKVNNQGFLGKDINIEKREDELRIALLGDSYVQSQVVFDKYSHRAVLEDLIRDSLPSKEVSVMNFGMAGFGLINMFCYDKNFVEKYQPDILLYFFATNTLVYNHKTLVPTLELKNGELIMKNDLQKSRTYLLFNKFPFLMRSAVLRMIYKTTEFKKQAGGIIFGKFYDIFSDEINRYEYIPSGKDDHLDSLNIKIITELSKLENVFIVFRQEPSQNLSILVDSLGIKTINLFYKLNEFKNLGINLNYFEVTNIEGHWNHQGNQIVGEYIGKELLRYFDKNLINEL